MASCLVSKGFGFYKRRERIEALRRRGGKEAKRSGFPSPFFERSSSSKGKKFLRKQGRLDKTNVHKFPCFLKNFFPLLHATQKGRSLRLSVSFFTLRL